MSSVKKSGCRQFIQYDEKICMVTKFFNGFSSVVIILVSPYRRMAIEIPGNHSFKVLCVV